MCHLMKDHMRATLSRAIGYTTTKDENFFTEGNYSGVLHSAPVEIKDSYLVVLFKWVGEAKDLFEVSEAFLGVLEDLFRI